MNLQDDIQVPRDVVPQMPDWWQKTALEVLGLTNHIHYPLKRANIHTLGQLLSCNRQTLLSTLGPQSLTSLISNLRANNVSVPRDWNEE